MRTYSGVIDELKSNNILGFDGELYDYKDFPLEELFNFFFEFCQEYLDRHDHPLVISPARIYFSTSLTINACAYMQKGYNLVEINKGVIFNLFDFFQSKKSIFSADEFIPYKNVADRFNASPEYLLFQFVTLFFIYHEVGHLMQRASSPLLEAEYLINKCTNVKEIRERHARELDADWYAATPIAMHIIQNSNNNDDDIESLSCLALAGIYCFFTMATSGFQEIYYRQECHPHPSVRLSYMIIFLLDAISHNHKEIPKKDILRKATILAEKIMANGTNIVEKQTIELYNNLDLIEQYVNEILDDRKSYSYMCGNTLT